MKTHATLPTLNRSLRCLTSTLLMMACAPFATAQLPVTSGLVLRLDASEITGVLPDAQLQTWPDTSLTVPANNAIREAASSAGFPKYVTNVLNGKPVVRFNSASSVGDHFRFNRISNIRTVFWVLKDEGLGDRFLLGDTETTNFARGTSGSTRKFWQNEASSPAVRGGQTKLMGNVVNGVTTNLPLSSFQLVSLVTTGPVQANQITQDRTVHGSWQGDFAEILIYDRALDATEENAVGTYLSNKYALVTSYPLAGPPAVPSTVAATPISSGAVTLSWAPVYSAATYTISYTAATAGATEVVVPGITASSTTISGLTNGQNYDFKVLAVNAAGSSAYSPVVNGTPAVSSVKDIVTFVVPGQPDGVVIGNTVTVTVPVGTNVTALSPTYTLSGVATGDPASGTTRDFSTDQTYTITAEDLSTKVYTVKVVSEAVASIFTWTGGSPGTWSDPAQWTNDLNNGFRPSISGASYYTLNFNQPTVATNDLSANFGINKLNFGNTVKIDGASILLSANGAVLPQINQNFTTTVNLNMPVTLGADTTLGGTGAGRVLINGPISGSGLVTKSGVNPVFELTGNNTYSGGTLITGGTLACGLLATSPLGNPVNVVVQPTGALALERNQITGNLALSGGTLKTANGWADDRWIGPVVLTATSTIDIGFTDGSLYLDGVVSGPGGIIKLGTSPRPLHFLGDNTFTGPLTLSAGSVIVESNGRLGGGSYAGDIGLQVAVATLTYAGNNPQTLSGVISGPGSLTKTTASTLTLTGVNTYTGTTTLNGGILAVNGNALSNLGKLVINDAKVQATGTETVGSLFFGATQKSVGTWGATGSGATNIDDLHFTGTTGVVLVSTGPGGVSDYTGWASAYLPVDVSNPALDADGDGLTNQQEYAFGLSPVSSASVNPISEKLDKTTGIFSYTRRATPASTGLSYTVATSTDLVTWTPDTGATQTITTTALGLETVKVTLSAAVPLAATKLFVRVSAAL